MGARLARGECRRCRSARCCCFGSRTSWSIVSLAMTPAVRARKGHERRGRRNCPRRHKVENRLVLGALASLVEAVCRENLTLFRRRPTVILLLRCPLAFGSAFTAEKNGDGPPTEAR